MREKLPTTIDDIFLSNLHRKEQYRKEEERLRKGSTL